MTNSTIVLTNDDEIKLKTLIAISRRNGHTRDEAALCQLAEEVGRALIVPSKDIPPNVVTMNSAVEARDMDTGESLRLTVSWPEDSDFTAGRVNVLAPLGMALLGANEGDEVEWPVPDGIRRIRLQSVVYQPESAAGRASCLVP